MAVDTSPGARVGPDPSLVYVAKSYIAQSIIDERLDKLGMRGSREDAVRLQGVAWIDSVRRSLHLPVRTFNTAVVYYHKFRLRHADIEYNWADASAAALFVACKVEDTLKKSRDILCAHYNLKKTPTEQLSPDDPRFEAHSKNIIALERLMLESAGFDFRTRHPQKTLLQVAKAVGFDVEREGKTAWYLCLDLYRTFAPLKHTRSTLALACIELTARLHGLKAEDYFDSGITSYDKWCTSRAEVMETLLDLLDLYTHYRASTAVGPLYPLETFIDIRILLNEEASAKNIPRHADYRNKNKDTNGQAHQGRNTVASASPATPATPNVVSPSQLPPSLGMRSQTGTVRYMLDASRAREERAIVDRYFVDEEEEYEEEVPSSETENGERRQRDPSSTSSASVAGIMSRPQAPREFENKSQRRIEKEPVHEITEEPPAAGPVTCVCGSSFDSRVEFKDHRQTLCLACRRCNKKSASIGALLHHFSYECLTCSNCNRIFGSGFVASQHRQLCYTCPGCQASFESRLQCRVHKAQCPVCPYCRAELGSIENLRVHLRDDCRAGLR